MLSSQRDDVSGAQEVFGAGEYTIAQFLCSVW